MKKILIESFVIFYFQWIYLGNDLEKLLWNQKIKNYFKTIIKNYKFYQNYDVSNGFILFQVSNFEVLTSIFNFSNNNF